MTCVNVNFGRAHVWLATDTLQYAPDGRPWSFATKCSVYPHMTAISGFRGLVGLHHRVDRFMNGGAWLERGIESAALQLPDTLRLARAEFIERYPDQADRITAQVWLLGWLATSRQFGAYLLSSDHDFEPAQLEPGTYLNPGSDSFKPPAVIAGPEQLVETVEVQRAMSLANVEHGGPAMGIGGDVLLVTLTAKGTGIRKAHRFADHAEVAAEIRERHRDR